MTSRKPESNFFKGLTRLPFHTLTLMVIVLLFGTGRVPEGQARIAVAALAGAILAPFYNSLADFLYIRVDNRLSNFGGNIPRSVYIALAVIVFFLGVVFVGISYVAVGFGIETLLLFGLWVVSGVQTYKYVDNA